MIYPSFDEFVQLSKKGNLIPVYKEIMGDMLTPVSSYLHLAAYSRYAFLLESVEGEEKIARFSFLSVNPELIIKIKDKKVEVIKVQNGKKKTTKAALKGNPLDYIRRLMKPYKFVQLKGLPRFCGGLVGYLSYDTVRFFEKIPLKTKDDLKLPDAVLALAKELLIFDHTRHALKVLCCVDVPEKCTLAQKKKAYERGVSRIESLIEELKKPLKSEKNKNGLKAVKSVELKPKSNLTQAAYQKIVEKAKEHIRAGDIIQVVLSQRFEVPLKTEAFNFYRALRSLNPSPYMYYLKSDDIQIAGSSPELLVRSEDGVVETRPIAGTRPRGKTAEEDAALAKDLLSDPKEIAEHIMLVDLGRNDLGRVCRKGSVEVSEFMKVEKYSHVMHIVSNVKGRLSEDKDPFDVLQAAFPAGTVSGAPKIRAMEIIEDLEKTRRGPYAGCIGYFSFSGNLDSCITIRTIVVNKKKAFIQAGAGIVADSVPVTEYQETVNKAKAQVTALALAQTL